MLAKGQGPPSPDSGPSHSERNPRHADEIRTWLVSYIADMLQVNPESIDVRLPFTYFGLSSAEAVILSGDLQKWLGGSPLPATLAWDFPTIEAVARHLGGASGARAAAVEPAIASANDELEQILSEIERLPEDEIPDSRDRKQVRDSGNSTE
jgi:acyl carrier protein